MTVPQSSTRVRNRLLAGLPADELERLQPHLKPVPLSHGDTIIEPNRSIEHVYFVERGMVSIVAHADGAAVEIGIAGSEGLVGTPILLGVSTTPHESMVQAPGAALRIEVQPLLEAIDDSALLRQRLLGYVQAFMVQSAQSAFCNGRHTIEQRLARWLLIAHDRLDSADLPLTHEFISMMLGVRRPGVTTALHVLEGEKAIRATRGRITVLDRPKLEAMACSCYGIAKREMDRLTQAGSADEERVAGSALPNSRTGERP